MFSFNIFFIQHNINTESHLQCGLFLPGTCAATCPMAGLFCVGSILLSIYIINM